MRTVLICLLVTVFISCKNTGDDGQKNNSKDSTIGVDSTKIGADSGILRKLP